MPLILILLLAIFRCFITDHLITNPNHHQLGPYSWESNDFGAMRLGNAVAGFGSLDMDMVTILIVERDCDPTGLEGTRYNNRLLAVARPADYRKLKHTYETVLGDLKHFPIPKSWNKDMPEAMFEDGWIGGQGYASGGGGGGGRGDGQAKNGQEDGGQTDNGQESNGWQNSPKRRHEGCDIMGAKTPSEHYPVVSMTDGVIEKVG